MACRQTSYWSGQRGPLLKAVKPLQGCRSQFRQGKHNDTFTRTHEHRTTSLNQNVSSSVSSPSLSAHVELCENLDTLHAGNPVMRGVHSSTGADDIQMKKGIQSTQPQTAPPCPGCGKTMRLQQMANKTEVFFACSRFPLCKRVVHVPRTAASPVSPSAPSCSAAQTRDGCRISQLGGQLQHVGSPSRSTTKT